MPVCSQLGLHLPFCRDTQDHDCSLLQCVQHSSVPSTSRGRVTAPRHQPCSSSAYRAHASQWHGATLPEFNPCTQVVAAGRFGKVEQEKQKGRRPKAMAEHSVAAQAGGIAPVTCMTLRARDKLQRREGKPPAAALRATRDRESQAGYRGVGAIWDVPPQRWSSLDGPGCFYLCLSPFPKNTAHNPKPSLHSTLAGLGFCSHVSTCVGRGEHPLSLLSDPALAQEQQQEQGEGSACTPRREGQTSPPLPCRRHCQHAGRLPRSQRAYLQSSE